MKIQTTVRRFGAAAAALLMLLAVGGCTTKPGPVAVVSPQETIGTPNIIRDKRLITDEHTWHTLDIGDVNTATTDTGLLRVQVRLTNLTDKFQSVEYRFEWTDLQGMAVDTPASRYVLLKLKPRDSQLVSAVAPNAQTKDFMFKVDIRR